MIPPAEIKEMSIKDYLEIAVKHYWLILSIIVSMTGFTAFRDFTSPKLYLAKTTIVVETEKPKITGSVEGVYENQVTSKDYYQTQVNILQSRALAERVVKALGLDHDQEFMGAGSIVDAVLGMVRIEPSRLSNVITISVSGRDPLKITSIANTWVREYIHQDIEKRVETAKYGVSFLEKQLGDTLAKLREAEKQLNDFITVNKIVTIPDIESKSEALLESLKAQKAQLEKDIAEAAQRYKEKHPKMISLQTQLKAVEEKTDEETDSRLKLQAKIAEYGVLKRTVETYKSLYDEFIKRAKELDVSKELTISGIRLLDVAEEPKSPIRPKPSQDISVAFLVSSFLAVFLAFLLEHSDTTIKTSDEVEFYAKFPFLGYLPSLKKEVKEKKDIALISYREPQSRIAESFRNLKVSLLFSFPQDKPLRTIVVTSSIPAEGKSFTACNLAIIFAQAKEPTLLIDADMRKGNLQKIFGLKTKSGLSTLLTGMSSLEEAVVASPIPNLFMLTAGPYTPNPTELLSSEKLPHVLRELEKKYKKIIIDSTPILNVSEALILGDKCDGIMFVIRSRHTSLKDIAEAKKIIGNKVKVIGAVLNDVDMQRERYYYYHYYSSPGKENV